MRRLRLLTLAIVVAGVLGAFPAVASGPAYGTWTYAGSGTKWHGTFSYDKPLKSVFIQTRAGAANPVVSFVIGGTSGERKMHGAGVVYSKPKTLTGKLAWSLVVAKPLSSSALINPCVSPDGSHFYCRFSR